jgi:hypothetical protein
MPAKLRVVTAAETIEKRPVVSKGRKTNIDYRVREHLTETEMDQWTSTWPRSSATGMATAIG